MGYRIWATAGTAGALTAAGIPSQRVKKIGEGSPHIVDFIREGKVDLVINTVTRGKEPNRDGFRIRRAAVEMGIPCLTSLDTARALLESLSALAEGKGMEVEALQDYLGKEDQGDKG